MRIFQGIPGDLIQLCKAAYARDIKTNKRIYSIGKDELVVYVGRQGMSFIVVHRQNVVYVSNLLPEDVIISRFSDCLDV